MHMHTYTHVYIRTHMHDPLPPPPPPNTHAHTHTGSPEILHPFNRTVDVIVSIDTTAEFICPYLAYPQPIVVWYAMDDQGMFEQLGEDTDDRYRHVFITIT